jgi:hypothetical protein
MPVMRRITRSGQKRMIMLLLVIFLLPALTGCIALVAGGLQGAGEAMQENAERAL